MSIIDERSAWEILRKYVEDCLKIDSNSRTAIYATGSLPSGYYRPGKSDIDAVLIGKNEFQDIWGNSKTPGKRFAALYRTYLHRYKIPKDFGPFPLGESELFPPYNPDIEVLPLEIARLMIQGKLVYGSFNLEMVPISSSNDFLIGAKAFEAWWDQEFSKATPLEKMSTAACVNTILIHLSRFLIIERDIFEFNKRKIISTYLTNKPPIINENVYALVNAHLQGQTLTDAQVEITKRFTLELRLEMNGIVGIRTQEK